DTALNALSHGGRVLGLYLDGLSVAHDVRLNAVTDQWPAYRDSANGLLPAIEANIHQGVGPRSHRHPAAQAGLHQQFEQVTSHAAALLARNEALMSSILREIQLHQEDTLNSLYWLVAVDALLILLAFMAVRRQIVTPLREMSTHCKELADG